VREFSFTRYRSFHKEQKLSTGSSHPSVSFTWHNHVAAIRPSNLLSLLPMTLQTPFSAYTLFVFATGACGATTLYFTLALIKSTTPGPNSRGLSLSVLLDMEKIQFPYVKAKSQSAEHNN
jgi:hypothetical protein